MSPKTGRPPSNNPRLHKIEVRMSDKELEMLDFCCGEIGRPRSEIIRDSIYKFYAELRNLK